MRVAVMVTGRPLMFGGARHNVGERLLLDPTNEQHREILDSDGWVRRLDAAAIPVVTAAPIVPPAHKMITQPWQRKAGAKTGRGK